MSPFCSIIRGKKGKYVGQSQVPINHHMFLLKAQQSDGGVAINKKVMLECTEVLMQRCYANRVRDGVFRVIPMGSTTFST